MSADRIDGKAFAANVRAQVAAHVARLKEENGIQPGQILNRVIAVNAKIRRNRNRFPAGFHAVADRLCRIVGDRKRMYGDVSQCKRVIRVNHVENPLRELSKALRLLHRLNCSIRCVNRNTVPARQHGEEQGRDRAGAERTQRRGGQRMARLPLPRHLVAVYRGHRRG